MRRVAVYTMSRNYYEVAIPAIKSLLINGAPDLIYILVEDDYVPIDLPKVKFINMARQNIFWQQGPNFTSRWTYMAMMKVALFKVLEDEDRVLSLDCDTFVVRDISELWELPIDDYYLAAGKEPGKSRPDFMSINGGVMLQNLAKLRDGKGEDLIIAMNTTRLAFVDQDAISELCQGGILELPPEFNVHPWAVRTNKEPAIIHYAAIRDWTKQPLYLKYKRAEVST